jgi:DNA polymerase phi
METANPLCLGCTPSATSSRTKIYHTCQRVIPGILPSGSRRYTISQPFVIFTKSTLQSSTESLFSSTSSPERKYWGFQVFQKALQRVSQNDMPLLFTKNFMRSWINHLSQKDRYLHKIARQVVRELQKETACLAIEH